MFDNDLNHSYPAVSHSVNLICSPSIVSILLNYSNPIVG